MSNPGSATLSASPHAALGTVRQQAWLTPLVAAIGLGALTLLPWGIDGGPSGLSLALAGAAPPWPAYPATLALGPLIVAALVLVAVTWLGQHRISMLIAGLGLAWGFAQGFVAGTHAPAFGFGAALSLAAFAVCFAHGLARRGMFNANLTIATTVVVIAALLLVFVMYPVGASLLSAVLDRSGRFAPALLAERLFTADLWGIGCVVGSTRCGVAINSVLLAALVGIVSTLLGLVLALVVQRGGQRYAGLLKVMSILPFITPPFVVALALIVLFGRTGLVTGWLSDAFGVSRSRWIYGLPGLALAQTLTFAPIGFLILHGALSAISPALEEAAQTLRASSWRVFRTVTWPLLRPGLAAAFLLCFVESLADFGNPIVLAGNFEVLSIKIFFAIAGAQYDAGRAAALAMVLLALTLAAFWLQQRWLGRASYVTVSGKGDGGAPAALPRSLWVGCLFTAAVWIGFTLVCYAVIFTGGVVKDIGRGDMTPTFRHLASGFGAEWTTRGVLFTGSAWDSLFTTLEVAALSAPLTAAIGLLAAYVITRHRFGGRRAFEFLTLVSFAIPGTVIGVSYIVAFNVPPLELTGGMAILVLCFVFRNMPVGVRAGIAALAQIDKTLDEASSTLRASTLRTLRRVVMPLLRPAILVTLVFSFTHAMTAVSAVIFLATAKYNLATVYIMNRVEAGEYPLAIAYSSLMIVILLVAVLAMQKVVGEARLGRRPAGALVAVH